MSFIPKNKRYPTYPGMYEGITSDQFAANEGRGSAGGETKSKAKTVISKTFDQSGQTDLQVDTDEAGVVTTTKQVTPTAVLDAMVELESYESLGLFPSQSIATPTADVVETETEEVDDEEYGEIIVAPGGMKMVWSYRHNGYIPYDQYLEGTQEFPQYTDLSMFDMSMADGPESRLGKAKNTGTNDSEDDLNVSNVKSTYQEGTKEDYLAWSAQSAMNDVVNEELAIDGDYYFSRPDPHSGDYDAILKEDSEVFDNLDDATGGDGVVPDVLIDALKEIKETDPTGKGIDTLNAFADWADTHTDQEAEREAEIYLQSLKDSPSVDSKFRKAMAIAMMGMLFGDDFTTAMNTGFGVVADDYAAEALAAKTQAEANEVLAKEQRKFAYETLGSERDFAEQVALKGMEQDASTVKERKAAESKRLKDNVELGAKVLSEMIESVKAHPKYQMSGLAGQSVTQQMSGFMDEIESSSPDGFKLDLYNNKQMYAMSGALENFIHQSLHYDKLGAPDAKSYASEMFTKLEVEKYTDISPNIISPSASLLNGAGTGEANKVRLTKIKGEETAPTHYVDPNVLREKYQGTRNGHKQTIRLGETVTALAGLKSAAGNVMGEQTALILLKKDYDDFLRFQPESFRRNERMAYSAGVGPFTRFVLTELAGKTNDTIGINFDTVLQNSSITDRNTVLSGYIKTKSKIKT